MRLAKHIIELAEQLRDGHVHMVVGVRALLGFLPDDLRLDPRFNIFVYVDSEADPWPVRDSVRALWNADALRKIDAEFVGWLASCEPDIKAACNELIGEMMRRLSPPNRDGPAERVLGGAISSPLGALGPVSRYPRGRGTSRQGQDGSPTQFTPVRGGSNGPV